MLKFEYNAVNTFCNLPFQHVKINVNGDVAMCCYQGEYLGNVLRQPLEEIWNSAVAKEIRLHTSFGVLHPKCKNWGGCPFFNKDLSHRYRVDYHGYLPVSVEIDLPSSHCNIGGESPSEDNPACVMCPRNFEKFRTHPFWSMDNTAKIAESLRFLVPHMRSFCVLGVAEPFWRGKLFEIFDILDFKSHKENIHFWTFTNGSVFNDAIQERFLAHTHGSYLHVSVDAATRETYMRVRRRDFLDIIKRNLTAYNARRDRAWQKFEIYNNINTLNVHEMAGMVRFAKDCGADRVQFNPTHDAGGMSAVEAIMVNRDNLPVFLKHQREAERVAREEGVTMVMYRTFEQVVGEPQKLVQLQVKQS